MVEVVRTNFAPIFSDFENVPAHWRTNRSENFQICSTHWKGLFFPEKSLQILSKSVYKHRRYLLLNNATASLVTVKPRTLFTNKK